MEKVIPPGLNYADIKPEAIENQIRIVKFTPQSTIVQAKPNDIVRFFIQGNGFYDPYSAYIRITVKPDSDFIQGALNQNQWAARLLDRSAHSLFQRLVIRSQGTELERIEQYDVMAAMINDMVYSHEQRMLHHYEGFASQNAVLTQPQTPSSGFTTQFGSLLHSAASPVATNVGDVGWWRVGSQVYDDTNSGVSASLTEKFLGGQNLANNTPVTGHLEACVESAKQVLRVQNGIPQPVLPTTNLVANNGGGAVLVQNAVDMVDEITFCLPIYSGVLGVLMPDKKLLPLSLMPLEVEFTMNPYAFYGAGTDGVAQGSGRGYVVSNFEIFAHTLFFEQELHRSMEAIVAEHGIFIHYNSFYLAPITTWTTAGVNQQTPSYAQINSYAKSINSIHFVFLKTGYEAAANAPRKLQFISNQLEKLQLRNGLDLIPSEPIVGKVGNSFNGLHVPFLIETYKAFNKMHDPATDSNLTAITYNLSQPFNKPNTLQLLTLQQAYLPRCQYAISLEGELIGQQQSVMCGRKGMMPFDVNFLGNCVDQGQYIMLIYTRADYIIYVRPDLVVQRLGV